MAITKIDYATQVVEALQGAYRQDWCLTNWTGTGKPLMPAGMIVSILGYPYIVAGGDETPDDPAGDGAVYLKITPDAPAGATATAEYTNDFTGTWNESYNGFYDGDSLFLNVFMTKTAAVWSDKGVWLNFREQKLKLISEDLFVDGDVVGNKISATTEFLPPNTSAFSTFSLAKSSSVVLERGCYSITSDPTTYLEMEIGGSWLALTAISASIGRHWTGFSDGTNFRVINTDTVNAKTVYLRKFHT